MIKRIAFTLTIFFMGMVILSGQAFAQGPIQTHVAIGYNKGNSNFNIVAKGNPGDQLELYVNDKDPSKATVNKKGWATFHGVKLVGSGKISFTRIITRTNKSIYQRRINFHEQYTISQDRAIFTYGTTHAKPKVTQNSAATTAPAPASTAPVSTPAASEPVCTNGIYVNSSGNTVCRPETSSTAPAGATAKCGDGTYNFSQHHSGTCSHHGGVAEWL